MDLVIHDLPEQEVSALAARGRRHGRTAEEEARQLIHEAATEELLLGQLDAATRAVEARLRTAEQALGTAAPTRRRYRRVEPTPRPR